MLRALDEQIREHRWLIIERKRIQNSLLNISRIPPEILGYIFWLSSTPEEFEKRSINSLLVCHHWYEVASSTPELWDSWGNTLQDWTNRHLRFPEILLDLVLDGGEPDRISLDPSVQKTLRYRASRDTIRLVHLRSEDRELLSSILRTLATDTEEVRCSSVESFVLQNEDKRPVDTSEFFGSAFFPKLRKLDLTNCMISWDNLTLRTELLTTLILHLDSPSSTPTTPQLLSLLACSPSLQELVLTGYSLPADGNEDDFQVMLPELKEVRLAGECEDVSMLLSRMIYPILNHLHITLDGCTVENIPETIGPHLRENFQRRGRSQSGLGIFTSFASNLIFRVGDGLGNLHSPTLISEQIVPFLAIKITMALNLPQDSPGELFLSLLAHTPQDEISSLQMCGTPTTRRSSATAMADVYSLLPNLRVLRSKLMHLSTVFPAPGPDGNNRFPSPSLRYVFLDRTYMRHGSDWTPLTNFLSSSLQMSPVKRLDFLQISTRVYIPSEIEENIRSLVQEFRLVRIT